MEKQKKKNEKELRKEKEAAGDWFGPDLITAHGPVTLVTESVHLFLSLTRWHPGPTR
jgi:hypothetical protein